MSLNISMLCGSNGATTTSPSGSGRSPHHLAPRKCTCPPQKEALSFAALSFGYAAIFLLFFLAGYQYDALNKCTKGCVPDAKRDSHRIGEYPVACDEDDMIANIWVGTLKGKSHQLGIDLRLMICKQDRIFRALSWLDIFLIVSIPRTRERCWSTSGRINSMPNRK